MSVMAVVLSMVPVGRARSDTNGRESSDAACLTWFSS